MSILIFYVYNIDVLLLYFVQDYVLYILTNSIKLIISYFRNLFVLMLTRYSIYPIFSTSVYVSWLSKPRKRIQVLNKYYNTIISNRLDGIIME